MFKINSVNACLEIFIMPHQLKKMRKSRGFSQSDMGAALGIAETNYNKLENSHTNLTLEKMERIAEVLNCDPVDLIANFMNTRNVSVSGYVEAGAWSEAIEWDEDLRYEVSVPDDEHLRPYHLHGLQTRGPSMNKRYPEGTVLIYTSIIETREEIVPGRRYIVEREKADGLREATVKTLSQDDDGKYWLMPESTSPHHQQPIEINGGTDDTVRIIGRVTYSLQRED